MMPKLRIAVYSGVSTSTTFIERLISGLAKQDVSVLIFGLDKGKTQSSKFVHYYTYKGRLQKLFRLLQYSILLGLMKPKAKRQLDRFIKQHPSAQKLLLRVKYYPVLYHKPDVFHLQWAKSLADWIWVEDFGIRMVLSLRGTHLTISPIANFELKTDYSTLFPRVSAFHCVSQSIANELLTYNVPRHKQYIIKSGLPLNEFRFSSHSKKNTPVKILSIGRSHFAKGYRYALDAMALLKTQSVPFKYTIIGVGQDEALWHQRHDLDVEDRVEFTEQQDFNDVKKALIDADVLLLPSITEGIANVVLEAMALGTLVISSDCGGMSEVIETGVTGFLVPSNKPQALKEAVLEARDLDTDSYVAITQAARSFVEQVHCEEHMVLKFKALYASLITEAI